MNNEIYGTDYSSTGYITSTGDIGLSTGLDNCKQSIHNHLLTRVGTYDFSKNYGSLIMDVIGEDNNNITLQILEVHLRNALAQEPRVKEIKSITSYFTITGIHSTIRVLLVSQDEEIIEIQI